jgi:hypothetical protein
MTCLSTLVTALPAGQRLIELMCCLDAEHMGDHWDETFSQAWGQVAVRR